MKREAGNVAPIRTGRVILSSLMLLPSTAAVLHLGCTGRAFAESRSLLCITPAVLDSTQPPLGLTKTLPVFPPFSLSRPSSSPYLQPLHQVLDTRPPLRTIFPHTLHDKFLV